MTDLIGLLLPLPQWALIILAGLFTLLGYLLIYGARAYLRASREFRNTIYAELEGLYPTPTKWPENSMDIIHILKEKYPRLEIAVHKFKGHLPTCFVKGFNKAWIKYYNADEKEGWQHYFHYVPIKGESSSFGETTYKYDNTTNYKDNFRENVDGLLKYAKQI